MTTYFETADRDTPPADDARKGVLVRLSAETRKALKLLAVGQDTTVQALVTEAIDDLLGEARKR